MILLPYTQINVANVSKKIINNTNYWLDDYTINQ